MMKILHVVPGLNERGNGMAVAARLIADGQRRAGIEAHVVEVSELDRPQPVAGPSFHITAQNEVWVHSMWTPTVWKACWKVLKSRAAIGEPRLVRMTHANLDPVRYRYHGLRKRLVAPIERWLFSKTDRVVVTCEAEAAWCRQWGLKNEMESVDLKWFFDLKQRCDAGVDDEALHVLYLGRRHPLKGVGFLERAVRAINAADRIPTGGRRRIDLRIVNDHFGEELDRDWEWADVLALPTLSENFGLVVAEALERGKFVITTDGAPAWADLKPEQGIYLKGYRNGTPRDRVDLLRCALAHWVD